MREEPGWNGPQMGMRVDETRYPCGEPEFLPGRGFAVDLMDNKEQFTFVKQVVLIN